MNNPSPATKNKKSPLRLLKIFISSSIAAVLFLLVLPYFALTRMPVASTVRENEMTQGLIIRLASDSETGWLIVGNENGLYDDGSATPVRLDYRLPPSSPECAADGTSLYYCKGRYIGVKTDGEPRLYRVSDWYPIYPVTRTQTLMPAAFYPASYISRADIGKTTVFDFIEGVFSILGEKKDKYDIIS